MLISEKMEHGKSLFGLHAMGSRMTVDCFILYLNGITAEG